MNEHDATELAFKNGYKKAVMDVFEEIESIFIDGCDYYHSMEIGDYAELKKKYTGVAE